VTRITRTISKPFDQVLERLHSSIKQPGGTGLGILDQLQSKEDFEKATNAALGPHGFMQFQQFDHGSWMSLYGVNGGRKVTRIIFGNPQVAVTMLRHDVSAGLFVPVEVLIIEREDGKGTDVVQGKLVPRDFVIGMDRRLTSLKQ
jgi:exonuclease V